MFNKNGKRGTKKYWFDYFIVVYNDTSQQNKLVWSLIKLTVDVFLYKYNMKIVYIFYKCHYNNKHVLSRIVFVCMVN